VPPWTPGEIEAGPVGRHPNAVHRETDCFAHAAAFAEDTTIFLPPAFKFVPGGTIPNHVSASFGVTSSGWLLKIMAGLLTTDRTHVFRCSDLLSVINAA
jgi:hypothetical protein